MYRIYHYSYFIYYLYHSICVIESFYLLGGPIQISYCAECIFYILGQTTKDRSFHDFWKFWCKRCRLL